MECKHNWKKLCYAHNIRLNKDGYGYRCEKCSQVGFKQTDNYLEKEDNCFENIHVVAKPKELYQIEFHRSGRLMGVTSTHL